MPQQQALSVQIYDRTYRLSSEDQDSQYIARAAEYLDQKMKESAKGADPRRPLDIAILAAVNIAEEVLEARGKKEGLLSEADQRISRFTRLLEDQTGSTSANDKDEPDPPPRRF